MEINTSKYEFEALIQDETFRAWVFDFDAESTKLWNRDVVSFPQFGKKIQLAKAFLLSLENKNTPLNDLQLSDITANILARSNAKTPHVI